MLWIWLPVHKVHQRFQVTKWDIFEKDDSVLVSLLTKQLLQRERIWKRPFESESVWEGYRKVLRASKEDQPVHFDWLAFCC